MKLKEDTHNAEWIDPPPRFFLSRQALNAPLEDSMPISEHLRKTVFGGVLSAHPAFQAAARAAQQEEVRKHQAHSFGLAPAVVDRMARVARYVGQRTLLPNGEVWAATWQSMQERAARGEPPIPDDDPPIAWADSIWTIMFHAAARFNDMPHIVALVKALSDAQASLPSEPQTTREPR